MIVHGCSPASLHPWTVYPLAKLFLRLSLDEAQPNSPEFYRAVMKVLSVALSTLLAAGFIQTAVGINCNDGCAACWLDNNPNGVDTKIGCYNSNGGILDCGDTCPTGYHGLHCAKTARCVCHVSGEGCDEFGPCQYGVLTARHGYKYCARAPS